MSGESVPYHLRPNKYIERKIFIELLGKLSAFHPSHHYAYISMGGKYLEDFKLIHEYLEIENLISIEKDEVTLGRQYFNKPLQLINCFQGSCTDFIRKFETYYGNIIKTHNVIFWLDFANARGRRNQIQDYETLVGKLAPFDIVKITLNCNSSTLYNSNADDADEPNRTAAIESIKRTLGDYCPTRQIDVTEINDKDFAKILLEAVGRAGLKGMKNKRGCTLHPLSAFRYNDGYHSMVTHTAIILPTASIAGLEEKANLTNWPYYFEASQIHEISVPDLSFKEKIYIDERLFTAPSEKIHRKMPFKLGPTRETSLNALKSYVHHYRRYPQFARVIV